MHWSYSGPYFPASGLNTNQNNSKYENFSHIEGHDQTEFEYTPQD